MAIDYLETLGDVDREHIGIVGWSLGGYYAPRAASYERCLQLYGAWGANHNRGELQCRRLAREGPSAGNERSEATRSIFKILGLML